MGNSKRSTTLLSICSLVYVTLAASTPGQAQVYSIKDLGVLPGQTTSSANNLNEAGQVVGNSGNAAFLWNNGSIIRVGASSTASTQANAINGVGDIVGSDVVGSAPLAFLKSGYSFYYLHPLYYGAITPFENTYAADINQWGQIVGAGEVGPPLSTHAYLKNGAAGGTIDLGVGSGGIASFARAINWRAEVVGFRYIPNPGTALTRAFIWDINTGIVDIGTLGGATTSSAAYDINDDSTVVGQANSHAFVWTRSGGMADLGTLGGLASTAYGINLNGTIVGTSLNASGQPKAFYWTAPPVFEPVNGPAKTQRILPPRIGGMQELNTLLPAGSGWDLKVARAINNKGQIVGSGTHNGAARAFLLTPTQVTSLALGRTSVTGGTTFLGTILLNDFAPADVVITLKSSDPSVSVPATVTIPAGNSSTNFTLNTFSVAATRNVTITASYANTSASDSVTILTPVVSGLTLSPSTVMAGQSSKSSITLSGPVAVDTTVSLSSNNSVVAAPTVSSIVIPAGSSTGRFTIQSSLRVANTVTVTISAGMNGASLSAPLKVEPGFVVPF